jgi:hypothetical protein
MGRSIRVTYTIEVRDTDGWYRANWPRGAGRPSNASLARLIATIEAAGDPVVWSARVLHQYERAVKASYRGPDFIVDVAA